jgi:hypothetical protein
VTHLIDTVTERPGHARSWSCQCWAGPWVVNIPAAFTSLPCAQDPGGENPCTDTKDVLKLLIVGDSAVRLLVTLGARSAW